MMCVPLWDHERRPVGVIQIDTCDARGRFGQPELDFLLAVAGMVSMAAENVRLHEVEGQQRQIEAEARHAREVQRGLIPERRPVRDGYAFWDHYEPARFVGGDYFDYRPVPVRGKADATAEGPYLAIALGDVAGKGMPAALLMARLSSEVRWLVRTCSEPARVVERLNRSLCEYGASERFVTFLLIRLDGRRHTLTVVNAGHMPPLVRRADGKIEVVGDRQAGLPLGVMAEVRYRSSRISIHPGDVVVLYTDGVSDALDPEGRPFGLAGLERILAVAPPDVDGTGEAILDSLRTHAAGRSQYDDITLLCLGRQ